MSELDYDELFPSEKPGFNSQEANRYYQSYKKCIWCGKGLRNKEVLIHVSCSQQRKKMKEL